MSTNNIQTPLTEIDEAGQIGIDGFGQMMHYSNGRIRPIIDVRGHTCELCGNCWELTTKSWIDQFPHPHFGVLLHESCYVRHLAFEQKTAWFWALCGSRLRFDGLRPIPNQYGGAWNTPWYEVDLIDHDTRLVLGRRKRVDVIEITVNSSKRNAALSEFSKLVENEDVTKGMNGESYQIHSWSKEKSAEYLKLLATALGDGEFVPVAISRFSV